jgi:hypothetical protein
MKSLVSNTFLNTPAVCLPFIHTPEFVCDKTAGSWGKGKKENISNQSLYLLQTVKWYGFPCNISKVKQIYTTAVPTQ